MKLFLSLLIVPLLASPWAAGLEARASKTGCNADNCLRALRNPTRTAAATSFCHSYTQASVTATTSLPPQFATASSANVWRYQFGQQQLRGLWERGILRSGSQI
ncbi:hypothetical protein LZ32DRAFT_679748 [Colletotrichum eremochloae]|nr:hypothetical protein LZ32DRAFT_679748 [Colletotrichum eremochloae]